MDADIARSLSLVDEHSLPNLELTISMFCEGVDCGIGLREIPLCVIYFSLSRKGRKSLFLWLIGLVKVKDISPSCFA